MGWGIGGRLIALILFWMKNNFNLAGARSHSHLALASPTRFNSLASPTRSPSPLALTTSTLASHSTYESPPYPPLPIAHSHIAGAKRHIRGLLIGRMRKQMRKPHRNGIDKPIKGTATA